MSGMGGQLNRNRGSINFGIYKKPPTMNQKDPALCQKSVVFSQEAPVLCQKTSAFYQEAMVLYQKTIAFCQRPCVFIQKATVFIQKACVLCQMRVALFRSDCICKSLNNKTCRRSKIPPAGSCRKGYQFLILLNSKPDTSR